MAVNTREQSPGQRDHGKTEDASLGTGRTATQPLRTAQARTEQVPRRRHSAVRNRIEKCLPPIPSGMKSYGKPKIARAPQGEAEEQPDKCRCQQARPMLLIVLQMDQAKSTGKGYGRGPEANPARKSELGISTQQEFFEQSHDQEEYSPKHGKFRDADSVQREVPE